MNEKIVCADIDDIYSLGEYVDMVFAQEDDDEFEIYERWILDGIRYNIGRNCIKDGERTSIIVGTTKMLVCCDCGQEKPDFDFTDNTDDDCDLEICLDCMKQTVEYQEIRNKLNGVSDELNKYVEKYKGSNISLAKELCTDFNKLLL